MFLAIVVPSIYNNPPAIASVAHRAVASSDAADPREGGQIMAWDGDEQGVGCQRSKTSHFCIVFDGKRAR